MIKRRRHSAGRRTGNALVPVFGKKALPQIYLQDTSIKTPAVFLPESGESGAATRFKWFVSTCLAGVVGVGVIGVSVYASLNMGDGTGIVSSIRSASIAALKPATHTKAVKREQTVAGRKTSRIQTTDRVLATKQIIHDSVDERVGERDYIKIKPYARVIARLATIPPENDRDIPAFNPFKLYSNPKPIADGNDDRGPDDINNEVSLRVVAYEGSILPVEDSLELDAGKVALLISETGDILSDGPYAMRPAILPGGAGNNALLHQAAYRRDAIPGAELQENNVPPRTTIIEKSWIETEEETVQSNAEIKSVTVRRGDTLISIFTGSGAEGWQAKAIYEAMEPVFSAKDLKKGQDIHFTLVPGSSDSGKMEPVKISLFTGNHHEVTVARNAAGDYVASDEPIDLTAAKGLRKRSKRATLYTSFYDAALNQDIPQKMITRVLRIHSYDVDFKRRVRSGDTFEMFFDLQKDERGNETAPGELLYTSMTVGGEIKRFYRFRAPEGDIDFYDADGNSAKKFLMRIPVKGARFTSGFGMRRHPVSRRTRMHTGTDWGAKSGTPILAAGNGIIEEAGRKGGYGNYVRIRHANGFKTAYGHMRGFAKGMRPGLKVSQGQVIGYVGSTGVSTGPHLHFEVLVNNRHVNPMTIHVPRGRQLTKKLLASFQKERARIEELMRRAPVTTRVAAATQRAQ